MTYTLQEQYTSKNQVAGASADSVWHLGARKVSSITIHHWGLKGQQFDTVRDFLCTNTTPTSAHYVAQDGLVACIVSPDDCAFHAGNAEGNSHSIGIECRPEATDGDYATIAELIAYLRGIYGDIPLYPHNHWYNTACPGDYDLGRLDSLARGGAISVQSATITPATTPVQEDDMFSDSDRAALARIDAKVDPLPTGNYWTDMINAMARVDQRTWEAPGKQYWADLINAMARVDASAATGADPAALAQAIAEALPATDANALLDALAARLGGK